MNSELLEHLVQLVSELIRHAVSELLIEAISNLMYELLLALFHELVSPLFEARPSVLQLLFLSGVWVTITVTTFSMLGVIADHHTIRTLMSVVTLVRGLSRQLCVISEVLRFFNNTAFEALQLYLASLGVLLLATVFVPCSVVGRLLPTPAL